ncbi:hypothetical protein [Alkalibacillus salilacus]|nr:hypothetical protein [Alkalibacillus salilacus]
MKLITSISLATLTLLFSVNTIIADDSEKESTDDLENVEISITNNETGEVTHMDSKDEGVEVESTGNANSDGDIGTLSNSSKTKGYDVFIPIPNEDENSDSEQITTQSTSGRTETSGGVTAKLNVDYDVSIDNEQVRLNRVFGSWDSENYLDIIGREVTAHSGSLTGNKINRTPLYNRFSYTTGWDYNDRLVGDLAPRAWSTANVSVQGGGSFTVEVEFTYADDL